MQQLTQTVKILATICLLCLTAQSSIAQETMQRRLVYSARLTFQSYGLPFKNLQDSFKNIGGAIGIDYAYNRSHNIYQSFTFGFQHHSEHERLWYVNTQLAYRPLIFKHIEPGFAIGIGRAMTLSNTRNSYYQLENGAWKKSHRQSQGHWQAPISLSMGYRTKLTNGTVLTPYISYEATPLIKYNTAFAILPYSLLSVGTRIKFENPVKE
jgi:hypothetical protein